MLARLSRRRRKDVTVSFNTVKPTKKDNKIHLTMNTTKDALKVAPGFKYDRDKDGLGSRHQRAVTH